ncbi:hypothetical protein [Gryllotalpicola ginsengisoli]|uniref:hypothetical protein n=1 Tax=Gryllotalpicola ginsengisoli TaxID=444608 RepID=UPI0003B4456F|nr:hypothetical protein [Gryllotalpicola ginsengisoli]
MTALSLLLAAVGGGFAVFERGQVAIAASAHASAIKKKKSHDEKVAKREAAEAAEREAAQAVEDAAAELARQKAQADESAEEAGFTPSPTADGLVFYKPVEASCSLMSCAWLDIAVAQDCPNGVYVAANLETSSGVVVSYGNKITGALDPSHGAAIEIDFPNAPGGDLTYEITDAHCM